MRAFSLTLLFISALCPLQIAASAEENNGTPPLNPSVLGTYKSGHFDKSAAEIVVHDAKHQRLYVTNAHNKSIDVLDFKDPANLTRLSSISIRPYGRNINSVAVHNGLVAAAIEADPKQNDGVVVFFTSEGKHKRSVKVGALPDMLTFTSSGAYLLVANEGEPSKDYKTDPEGSVSLIKMADMSVRTVTFTGLKKSDFGEGAHFPSPKGTPLSKDIEPEYIAISEDDREAYVSLQENNAIAVIDIEAAKLTRVFTMGLKDFSKLAFDLTDKDGKTRLKPWPVKALYQPDGIASFTHAGKNYIITANEGDARDYDGYSEETRAGKLKLDETIFPRAEKLQKKKALGRLKVTTAMGDKDADGEYDALVAFGGRSFSIYTAEGRQIYDSGDEFSLLLSKKHPTWFNSEGQEETFDKRSDDKGVEPEAVVVGRVKGRRFAFIGLERMGGIMAYDIANPEAVSFAAYFHNANPGGSAEKGTAGDVAPEGLCFIAAANSPTGKALLVVANEVSGTVTAFGLE